MWGGGDVKLFTAIATVIPFGLNIDFLNIFPQLSLYPFAFSVVMNSILVSFPFLAIFVCHLIAKNETFKKHPFYLITLLNIENLRKINAVASDSAILPGTDEVLYETDPLWA